MSLFLITVQQVGILLFYIIVGYFFRRKNWVSDQAGKILAKFLTFFITPVYNLVNLTKNVNLENLITYATLFVAGLVATALYIAISIPISHFFSNQKLQRHIYSYMFAFSNLGYFGYPLVDAVFGSQALVEFMIFCIPLSIALNSYGYFILTDTYEGKNSKKANIKDILSRIFCPPVIGTVIGLVLAFSPLEMPSLFYEILSPAANSMSLMAMLLSGTVLASYSLKKLFSSAKAYLVGTVRLLILPALIGGICYLLYRLQVLNYQVVLPIMISSCLPAGMNVIVFPESVGMDSSTGARACFISYVMAIATIPIVFSVIEFLMA